MNSHSKQPSGETAPGEIEEAEPWEPWETRLCIGSLLLGLAGLAVLALVVESLFL